MKTLIISDFSKTFTAPTSKTTWSLFKESGLFPEEYSKRRDELFEIYRPYEIAGNNAKVREWFQKHLELLAEYDAVSKISEVVRISGEKGYLLPREGIEEFRTWCGENANDFNIVSSGISELIEEFLTKNGIWYKTNTAYGMVANHIPSEKNMVKVATPTDKFHHISFDFSKVDRIIILGDAPEDFVIQGVDYTKDGKFRGFSFSDTEIVSGVIPLGKNASFSDLISHLN